MKFSNKLSFAILATGLIVLIISSFTLYNFSYNTIINSQFMYTKSIADEISDDINILLFEKVKTALTLANTPIIKKALETSNLSYSDLSAEKRKESIKRLNEKWISTKDPADNFILKFTDNNVSAFLKEQQRILKGEYGEIFLTNKFGALVASTAKLSTLAHGHKYWWLGSYHNGEGAIFFDDCGYDDSVGGYVLGLVVPIRKGMEIIGILKCNLNILGSISELISDEKNQLLGKLKLVRSGGMVVFEKGFEPLSTQVHGFIFEKLKSRKSGSFIINDSGEKYIVGCSEIELTKGGGGYGFGGTFESIDHKKGNTGESWYVVYSCEMSAALMPITQSIKTVILIGIAIVLILVLVSYLFGRKIAKPLAVLNNATEKIGTGDFKYRIGVMGKDEFGNLGNSFNSMASKLQQTTISIVELEHEITERKQAEEALRESETRYRELFDNISSGVAIYEVRDNGNDFILKDFNKAGERLDGDHRENLVGKSIYEVRPSIEEFGLLDVFRRVWKTGASEHFSAKQYQDEHLQNWYENFVYRLPTGELVTVFEDITERKQTEEALRKSENKYRTFLETTSEGCWLLNPELKTIEVNAALCKKLGYSQDEMLGKTPFDFVDDKNRKVFIEQTSKISNTKHHSYEIVLKKKNGEDLHTYFNATTIRAESGEILFSFAFITDITERKQAEEALRVANERLELAMDAGEHGFWDWNIDTNEVFFSPRYYTMLGYENEELPMVLETWINLMHPEDRETIVPQTQKHVENAEPYEFEFRLKCKDGSWRWISGRGKSYDLDENGVSHRAVGLHVDITERKQAEEELRENESKFRNLFDLSPQAISLTDVKTGQLVDINNKFCGLTQYPKEDLIGKTTTEAGFYSKEDRSIFMKKLQASGEADGLEMKFKAKDGSIITALMFARVVNIEGRQLILTIFNDMTTQKYLEAQLLQSQKMESIGNLAGGIAHDFNNILSSVIGFTELSLDEVEKGTHIEDNLQEIYTAGKRAKDLVKQILAFARQSGEELKPIQVDTIATEVLKFIRYSIPTTIEIKQNMESDSLIMGNATQVHQILMNLFTNAAHAMEDKGGILEFSLKDVVMDRGVNRENLDLKPGNYIEIKVSDTGSGIAPEIIGSIFDPYFTTKGPGEGTGMGLATVHGIIESYGGKILVDSKPEQGTVFTIYLPVTRKRQEHRPYQPEMLPAGKERILFVDDEAPIAKMGGKALERLGYTVSIRTSSIEALELFRTKPNEFDLVITDMTMPNMTGDRLAIELMKIRPDIPVILCTGYSKRISEESASEMGIKAFAYKPVVKADLAKTVRKVLDDQQQEQTTGRILVIDDEPEIRKLFVQKLAGRGYEIIEACDGKEGLKLYHETRPDLVITDLVMPEKEGLETITELKREFPNVKIIAISGGGRNVPDCYLHVAKNLGADRTFPKPIDWPELIKTVRELLK